MSVDDWDRILDEGMASYVDAEPLAGLPERISARILYERRTRRWMAFAVTAVATGAVIVLPLLRPSPIERPKHPQTPLVAATAISAPVNRIEPTPQAIKCHRAPAMVKQKMFPTPTGLTREERALVELITNDPTGSRQVFESLQKSGEEIKIQPIVITPLDVDGDGQ